MLLNVLTVLYYSLFYIHTQISPKEKIILFIYHLFLWFTDHTYFLKNCLIDAHFVMKKMNYFSFIYTYEKQNQNNTLLYTNTHTLAKSQQFWVQHTIFSFNLAHQHFLYSQFMNANIQLLFHFIIMESKFFEWEKMHHKTCFFLNTVRFVLIWKKKLQNFKYVL